MRTFSLLALIGFAAAAKLPNTTPQTLAEVNENKFVLGDLDAYGAATDTGYIIAD